MYKCVVVVYDLVAANEEIFSETNYSGIRRRRWCLRSTGRNSGLIADLGFELERLDQMFLAVRRRSDQSLYVAVIQRLFDQQRLRQL